MPYGGVYAKISAASQTDPSNNKLTALVEASSRGTALRGLLLEAHASWTFGQTVLWTGIAAFILAGLMGVLVRSGFRHARRVPDSAGILTRVHTHFGAGLLGVETQGGTTGQRAWRLPVHLR
jgi:hypothetical protein